ncbi:cupin domain-containing protein [Luteimonas pelagia]
MTAAVATTANARHYAWGAGCDGWHLVEQPGLSVIRERLPAGTGETRHRHHAARQFFYVLSGRATMEIDGDELAIDADAGLEVAPGTPHRIRNDGPGDLHLLVVSAPRSHGDREELPA